MADFTITINDIHIPRIVAAVNGKYPTWQEENPEWTMVDMVKHLIKRRYLVSLVRKWELAEIRIDGHAAIKAIEQALEDID